MFSGVGFLALNLLHGNSNILVYMNITEEYGDPFLRESHVLGYNFKTIISFFHTAKTVKLNLQNSV